MRELLRVLENKEPLTQVFQEPEIPSEVIAKIQAKRAEHKALRWGTTVHAEYFRERILQDIGAAVVNLFPTPEEIERSKPRSWIVITLTMKPAQVESVYILNNHSEDQAMDYTAQMIGPEAAEKGKVQQSDSSGTIRWTASNDVLVTSLYRYDRTGERLEVIDPIIKYKAGVSDI